MSISVLEAAKRLQISQKQLYQELKNGQIRSAKLDDYRTINQGALEEYIARRRSLKFSQSNHNYFHTKRKRVKRRIG